MTVTLADVKPHLDIDLADISHDTELAAFLAAAIEVVENIVGPLTPREVVEEHYGHSGELWLRQRPVISVTSLSDDAGSYVTADLRVNTAWGTVRDYGSGTRLRGDVTVTYQAGRTTTPAAIRLAVLELVRLHWTGSQGGYRPGYGTPEDEGARTPIGFYVPGKVLELLEPFNLGPVLA